MIYFQCNKGRIQKFYFGTIGKIGNNAVFEVLSRCRELGAWFWRSENNRCHKILKAKNHLQWNLHLMIIVTRLAQLAGRPHKLT